MSQTSKSCIDIKNNEYSINGSHSFIENDFDISMKKFEKIIDEAETKSLFKNDQYQKWKNNCNFFELEDEMVFHFDIFEFKKNNQLTITNYVTRFKPLFQQIPSLLSLSLHLFKRIIWKKNLKIRESKALIKIFATCIWICQKILLEKGFKANKFEKIAGIPANFLSKMEKIILIDILFFDVGILRL